MKRIFQFSLFWVVMCVSTVSFASKVPASTQPGVVTPATGTPDLSAIDMKSAMHDFKSLSKAERKEKIKQAKKEISLFKEQQKQGMAPSTNTLLLVILALFIPPLAVYLHQGAINTKFWISLVLTLLFFIPGVIYSLIVVLGGA